MQSEMIGTYFSHKKTETSLLYLNLKTNFMKLPVSTFVGKLSLRKIRKSVEGEETSLESVSVSRTLAESLN